VRVVPAWWSGTPEAIATRDRSCPRARHLLERNDPYNDGGLTARKDTEMATANKEQIEERMTEALVSFGAEKDQIKRDANWESLDVDSLDLVELAQIVEEEYGVKMKEEDMKEMKTVGDAVDFVAERAGS